MRFRLDISYDGSNFHGWAAQPQLRTVEGLIGECLSRIARQPIRLTCAGRTDAGVHARAQVAHFDLDGPAGADYIETGHISGESDYVSMKIARRLNRMLPHDVTIRMCTPVDEAFDARFSAIERRYTYRICDIRSRLDPVSRHDVAVLPGPPLRPNTDEGLDVEAMNAASAFLIGEHDFAAFCKKRAGATTIRTLLELSTQREADLVQTTVRADAFCHSMVRALMGALVAVGQHRFDPDWAGRILAAQVRDSRVKVMAACGLTLEHVAYPPDDALAARAAAARRRRDRACHD